MVPPALGSSQLLGPPALWSPQNPLVPQPWLPRLLIYRTGDGDVNERKYNIFCVFAYFHCILVQCVYWKFFYVAFPPVCRVTCLYCQYLLGACLYCWHVIEEGEKTHRGPSLLLLYFYRVCNCIYFGANRKRPRQPAPLQLESQFLVTTPL